MNNHKDKPSILIIDDEPLLLLSFSSLLKSDFNVLTAPNGKEGLLKFKSNPSLSLILLDLNMPVMNGVETLKAIRASDDKVKVLIMTGRSSHEWAEQCADLAVQGYLKKPLEPKEMLARMKKLIGCHEDNFFHHLWGEEYREKLDSFGLLVRKMIEIVNMKFSSNICRKDMASKLKVSPDYLSKVFTKECGLPLSLYITKRRIYESKKLFSSPERCPISEVASHVGVSDVHYFSRLFKKHAGVSPKEYVEKYTIS